MPTFKPQVDQVYMGVRQLRRRRKARIAVVAAMVFAIPAVWFGIDQANNSLPPAASSPRKVNIPGVTIIEKPEIQFADASTGWAVYNFCSVHNNPYCQYAAGITTDGGRNWRGIKLPEIPDGLHASAYGHNAKEFFVAARKIRPNEPATGEFFWSTADGGASFTAITRQAWITGLEQGLNGGYKIECPGTLTSGTPQQYVPDSTCGTKLVKIGSGPVQPQPDGIDHRAELVYGNDGRLWLLAHDDAKSQRVRVSADQGASWQELPPIPGGSRLYPSPDGSEMYYSARGSSSDTGTLITPVKIAKLTDRGWDELPHVLPGSYGYLQPLGDGALFVQMVGDRGLEPLRLFKDGAEQHLPPQLAKAELGPPPLRDGTVVLSDPKGVYLGIGQGIDREWTLIAY